MSTRSSFTITESWSETIMKVQQKKIWITIEEENMKQLREKQVRGIKRLCKDYPMSMVVNDVLRDWFSQPETRCLTCGVKLEEKSNGD